MVLLDAAEDIDNVLSQGRRNRVHNALPGLGEFEAHGPPVAKISLAGDMTSAFETVEDTGNGLGLLGKVIGDEVGLRPIEGVNRQEGDRLNKSYIVFARKALIEFTHGSVRRPVEPGDKGKIVGRVSTHVNYGSTVNRPEKGNRLLEKRTVTNLKGIISQVKREAEFTHNG